MNILKSTLVRKIKDLASYCNELIIKYKSKKLECG